VARRGGEGGGAAARFLSGGLLSGVAQRNLA